MRTKIGSLLGIAAAAGITSSFFNLKPKHRSNISKYMNYDNNIQATNQADQDKLDKAKLKRTMKNIKRAKSVHK